MNVEMIHIVFLVLGCIAGLLVGYLLGLRRGTSTGAAAVEQAQQQLMAQREGLEREWNEERRTQAVKAAEAQALVDEQKRNAARLQQEVGELKTSLAATKTELHEAQLALATEKTQAEAARLASEERLKILQEAREQFRTEFKALSQQIFEEKTEKLGEQSKKLVDGSIAPLREQLGEFKKKIEDVYDKESKDRISLATQVEQLHRQSQSLGQQALNLTQALRGQSKVRGAWGEQTLERLLEVSGLVRGIEFEPQKSLTTEEGNRRQPDVIIHLPDQRHVVIDAKVSLNGYQDYCDSESDDARQEAIRAHIASLRGHINDLAAKDYSRLVGDGVVDFVLLFVPIEPALLIALQEDPDLFSSAYRRRVVIVGSTTLLATLRTIEGIWRVERQSKHAEEIARQAGELWDSMARTLESLESLGKQLDGSQKYFNETMNRLSRGRGNLQGRADQLRQLGVKGKKELPTALMDRINGTSPDSDEAGTKEPAIHTQPVVPTTTRRIA